MQGWGEVIRAACTPRGAQSELLKRRSPTRPCSLLAVLCAYPPCAAQPNDDSPADFRRTDWAWPVQWSLLRVNRTPCSLT